MMKILCEEEEVSKRLSGINEQNNRFPRSLEIWTKYHCHESCVLSVCRTVNVWYNDNIRYIDISIIPKKFLYQICIR